MFLPGWEEGLFPSQRTLDESGLQGLEEERRLAYVGITRAKERAKISYAANRRTHGMWQSAMPSRFISESKGPAFHSGYSSPGWQRAQNRRGEVFGSRPAIEAQAELVATSDPAAETYQRGARVFHQKFGYGRVTSIDGNKLTVDFDKAGEKRVIANFLARA